MPRQGKIGGEPFLSSVATTFDVDVDKKRRDGVDDDRLRRALTLDPGSLCLLTLMLLLSSNLLKVEAGT